MSALNDCMEQGIPAEWPWASYKQEIELCSVEPEKHGGVLHELAYPN